MRSLAGPSRALVGALLLATPATAQPRLGETAPGVSVDSVISGPATPELLASERSGKALVIEFWATWCGPCIGVLDHWNEMVAELEGEPIRFLSVTAEPAATVEPFLAGREIAGWVALDGDRSMFEAFGVQSIPHTFLIDRDGVLRAETYPTSVTSDILRDLIAGAPIEVPSANSFDDLIAARLDDRGRPEALVEAEVRPSVDASLQGTRAGPNEFLLLGATAVDGILAAFEGRSTRLKLEAELPDQRYDFVFRSPGDYASRLALMRRVVSEAFGITAERQSRRWKVLELRLREGSEPGLTPASGGAAGFSTYPGGIKGRGLDLGSLASALEFVVDRPIVDGTGLEGRWDVALEWDPELDGDLERALGEIGFELATAERDLEILVVGPRAADGS